MKGVTIFFVLIFVQYISTISGDTDEIEITKEEFLAVKNSLDFRGKVVLVTGSNSGMGAATVRLFSYLGAKVVVTGRNETRVKEVVNDCWKLSPDHIKPFGIALDLTIRGNVDKLVNETIKRFSKIDVLVNNAGVAYLTTMQDPKFNEVYLKVRAANEEVHVELTRLAAPYLVNTRGSIVFIASILAWNPIPSTAAYSMSKNSLKALAMTLATELGPNVRVNVISPGMVDGTRMFRYLPQGVRPTVIMKAISSSSLKRVGVPMDIAKTVVFLASPLSDYITGQELRLDGGSYISFL